MAATLSGQFAQVQITDYSGTLQDVTSYVQSFNAKRSSEATDVTTFATGGGAVTVNKIRGAAVAELTLNGVFDPAYIRILRQVIAARNGCTIYAKTGSNAAASQGDEVYYGTFTLFKLTFVYHSGALATVAAEFRPTDGGAITPGFYRV